MYRMAKPAVAILGVAGLVALVLYVAARCNSADSVIHRALSDLRNGAIAGKSPVARSTAQPPLWLPTPTARLIHVGDHGVPQILEELRNSHVGTTSESLFRRECIQALFAIGSLKSLGALASVLREGRATDFDAAFDAIVSTKEHFPLEPPAQFLDCLTNPDFLTPQLENSARSAYAALMAPECLALLNSPRDISLRQSLLQLRSEQLHRIEWDPSRQLYVLRR